MSNNTNANESASTSRITPTNLESNSREGVVAICTENDTTSAAAIDNAGNSANNACLVVALPATTTVPVVSDEQITKLDASLKLDIKSSAHESQVTKKDGLQLNESLTSNTRSTTTTTTTATTSTTSEAKENRNDDTANPNCFLLSDTTLKCAPLHLRQVFDHFDITQLSQGEILFLLIYVVALEVGLVATSEYDKCEDDVASIASTSLFNRLNVIHLSRYAPKYISDPHKTQFRLQLRYLLNKHTVVNQADLFLLLVGVVSGDFLIVSLNTENKASNRLGYSICLSTGRYVLNIRNSGNLLERRLRNCEELVQELRKKLFLPMYYQQMPLLGIHAYPSFVGLPIELYEEIFKYLKLRDLNALSGVNRFMHTITTQCKALRKRKRK